MSEFEKEIGQYPVKVAIIGESGSHKTGNIGSLASAGYRCMIADFDGGLNILRDPVVLAPEFRKNIYAKSFPVDDISSWNNFTAALASWTDGAESLGGVSTWGLGDVLVIDSASFMTRPAMRQILKAAGKGADAATFDQSLYGVLANTIFPVVAGLMSTRIKCNIVMNFHVKFRDNDLGVQHGVFSTEGAKLASELPKLFNDTWFAEKGTGMLQTRNSRLYGLKCSMPSIIAEKENPDLGDIFNRMKAAKPRTIQEPKK